MKVGDMVREWLKKLRGEMSEQDAAKKLGITQQYYNLIETGKRQKKMDIQLCEKIAKIFKVDIHTIIDWEIERIKTEEESI